jgi:hypothetical protein
MALLYQATLDPPKLELIAGWARSQPWFEGDSTAELTSLGAFRFDDPDGKVGIETFVVRAGKGPILQIPATYRDAPLTGGEPWLIGTLQHSVLGKRFVYDGAGDPAWLAAVATAALTGGHQADMDVQTDDGLVKRELVTFVEGSGSSDAPSVLAADLTNIATRPEKRATVTEAGGHRVTLVRVLEPGTISVETTATLMGTWPDQPLGTTLALVLRD